jgi:hypothetical protein
MAAAADWGMGLQTVAVAAAGAAGKG